MKAKRIIYDKLTTETLIVERVVWQLPQSCAERPHGLKYRLYCGRRDGTCVVRYDNEAGKGDHRHYGEREEGLLQFTLNLSKYKLNSLKWRD